MKKSFVSLCCLVALVGTLWGNMKVANAQVDNKTIISGNYEYQVIDEVTKTATLLKVKNYGEKLVLPSKIDGYKVVKIGLDVQEDDIQASDCEVLSNGAEIVEKIIIPEGVASIGAYSFMNTPSISQVIFPKSLKEIGYMNFMQAKKIKTLSLPGQIRIEGAFKDSVFDKVSVNGSLTGYYDDYAYGGSGMGGKIKNMLVKGSGKIEISCTANVSNLVVSKSVKELLLSSGSIKNIEIKNKKTKLFIDDRDAIVKGITIDMGKLKKTKNGKYSWAKPKVKIIENEKKNDKKIVTYVLKYKNKKGRWKTKKTRKNKIPGLKVKSSLKISAKIKY